MLKKEIYEAIINSLPKSTLHDELDTDELYFNAFRVNMLKNKPIYKVTSSDFLIRGYKLKSTDPIYNWCKAKGFVQIFENLFYLFDDNNLPISRLYMDFDGINFYGDEDLTKEYIPVASSCYEKKTYDTNKMTGVEITGFDNNGPKIKTVEFTHDKTLHPEFYPYLDGGFEELIRDFIMSDSSILILGGIPGSGKSVGIRETMIKLGIRPIIAQDAQAIRHHEFVNTLFTIYDSMYNNETKSDDEEEGEHKWRFDISAAIAEILPENKDTTGTVTIGSKEDRAALYFSSLSGERREHPKEEFSVPDVVVEDIEGMTLPIMLVEDADALLVGLNEGNEVIQNLRNRTDGITKTKPVKIIFTTNCDNSDNFDQPLLRDGRCYGFFPFPNLTPAQAIVARKIIGLPDFEEEPTKGMPLASALAQPRKKIFKSNDNRRFLLK